MAPLIAVIVGIGLYPKPLYERVTPTVDAILAEIDAPGSVSGLEPTD
jgi:NADH:ubiquinone oxidoreductase subunit 4 (subunit M)